MSMLAVRCLFVPWLLRRVRARSSAEMLNLPPALISSETSFDVSTVKLGSTTTKYTVSGNNEQLRWGQIIGMPCPLAAALA